MISSRIGVIQGRLSPPVNGQIQAFPEQHWREEFAAAQDISVNLIEWTLDHKGLADNPFMTVDGQAEIRWIQGRHGVRVCSVTADCLMQAPFFKARGSCRASLLEEFAALIRACGSLDVGQIVFPLVDNSSITDSREEDILRKGLREIEALLVATGVRVAFESDFPPTRLGQFIDTLPPELFGINYDIGNSASLGYSPKEEISTYGDRITNVHVKDRLKGGATVALGSGAADLSHTITCLRDSGYMGNYILQTARSPKGRDVEVIAQYRDMVMNWLDEGALA